MRQFLRHRSVLETTGQNNISGKHIEIYIALVRCSLVGRVIVELFVPTASSVHRLGFSPTVLRRYSSSHARARKSVGRVGEKTSKNSPRLTNKYDVFYGRTLSRVNVPISGRKSSRYFIAHVFRCSLSTVWPNDKPRTKNDRTRTTIVFSSSFQK